jgi:hypothetical protein
VDVGLEDVGYREAVAARDLEIDVDVGPRVDDRGDPRAVVAEKVRALRDPVGQVSIGIES